MTSEARGSLMRNTDFSIARILANDPKSCCETRFVSLDRERDAIRDDDIARKRKRAVEEEDTRDKKTNERCRERILSRYRKEEREHMIIAGAQQNNDDKESVIRRSDLTWLQYTRYKPPKLPRRSLVEKRTKRRAGDHPRIPFSSSQLQVLENRYKKSAYLSRNDVIEIAATLKLPQNKVRQKFSLYNNCIIICYKNM